MATAVSLWFDPALETRIRELWSELARLEICTILHRGPYRPHITLGVWEINPEPQCEAELRKTAQALRSVPISFNSIGLFPGEEGVAFLAPVVTAALLGIHGQIHSCMGQFQAPTVPYYRPGAWTPHCTMSWQTTPQQALRAAAQLMTDFKNLRGEVAAIGLIEIPAEIERCCIQLLPEV